MRHKNWSTLQKDDKLYLLIPIIDEEGIVKYTYQESHVINIHQYDWCTNIRFKYTDQNGKRQRIELCVNKYKYENLVVSTSKETGWARDTELKFGDILVSLYKTHLELILSGIIEKTIEAENKKIKEIKKTIKNLKKTYAEITK